MQFESVKDAVMQFESTNFIFFFLSKFSGYLPCISYVTLIIFWYQVLAQYLVLKVLQALLLVSKIACHNEDTIKS